MRCVGLTDAVGEGFGREMTRPVQILENHRGHVVGYERVQPYYEGSMGLRELREKITKDPKIGSAVGLGMLVLSVAAISLELRSGGTAPKAFYSTDDGLTWFADDAEQIPPFQHEDKDAVRAYVFQCKGGKEFVSYLLRYTPAGRKVVEDRLADRKAGKTPPRSPAVAGSASPLVGVEVKRPGAKDWVPGKNLAKASAVMNSKCPDGDGQPEQVVP